MKNSGSAPAAIDSVIVGNITSTPSDLTVKPTSLSGGFDVSGGFDGSVTITISNQQYLPGSLAKTNEDGTVPVLITVSEGSLTLTLPAQATLQSSTYP